MSRLHRLAKEILSYRQRVLATSIAMLLALFLTVPVVAIPPLIPIDPKIPDLFLAPSNLTASAVSDSEIDLSWQDNNSNELGFYVERKEEGASYFSNAYLGENTTSFADTGLKPNTTYYYRVRAVGSNGSSGYSNEVSAKTKIAIVPIVSKPSAPTDLTVINATADTINLSWKDNSSNEEGFFIHRKKEGAAGFTTIANVSANQTAFKDTGLAPATTYYYVVAAHNTAGASKDSNVVSSTTPAKAPAVKPLAPTLLTVVPGSDDTRIDITWQNNCTNETGFYIYRKTDGEANFTKIYDSGSAGWNGYGDAGLMPGTKYYYYVSAYNALGSADSNILSATTTGTPLAFKPHTPSDLTAKPMSDSIITLNWKDNSSNESSFVLERSLFQGSGYVIIATLPSGITTFDDTGLSALTTYFYQIKATNSAGDSAHSPLASATTLEIPVVQPPNNNQSSTVVLRFYIDKPKYYINDTASPMDAAPVIKENRTLLPIRFVASPLGAEVGWEQVSGKVTISHNGKKIEMWIGRNTAMVNEIQEMVDPDNRNVTPIIMPPGRTMLPLRFISENLGCKVDWNPALREAKITYPMP